VVVDAAFDKEVPESQKKVVVEDREQEANWEVDSEDCQGLEEYAKAGLDKHCKMRKESMTERTVRCIQGVGMTVGNCTVEAESIVADTVYQEDQAAVGKLPQGAHTVLVKRIHNPHLVYHHMVLEEEHKEIRSDRALANV
jgi:hypothetical protein